MNYKNIYYFLVLILLFAVIADHCVYFFQWYRDEFWHNDHIFMSYILPFYCRLLRERVRARASYWGYDRCDIWHLSILECDESLPSYSTLPLVQVNQICVKHRIERIASFFERRRLASRGSPTKVILTLHYRFFTITPGFIITLLLRSVILQPSLPLAIHSQTI